LEPTRERSPRSLALLPEVGRMEAVKTWLGAMNGSRCESKRWSATSATPRPSDGLDRSRPAAGGEHFRMACFVMHHTVVLSDIHLCEVEPESGLWMRYRQRAYLPDAELAAMLGALRERVG